MKLCQKFLLVIFMFIALKANANDIQVSTFTQLIDSNPVSGDTIEFTNDLFSDETIGNHFINLDINFEEVHNNIIIDDSDIIYNENINYTKYRPYAIFVNYKNYIFIILKNNSKEDLFNNNNFKLANLISQEFPNKKIKLTNLNFF